MNGDGSSLRAVFPRLDKALVKQARRVDGTARVCPDPREQCVLVPGLRDVVAAGAQPLPEPDRGHRSPIHEIRARTLRLAANSQLGMAVL